MNKSLVFIDSGIGGLSTLSSTILNLKHNIIYFADNKFAPYGNLSKKQIMERIKAIVLTLKNKFKPLGFVIACNTATTSSIKDIRSQFKPDIFIGTEPAIKLSKKLGFYKPLVIATPQTIKQIKYSKQIDALPLKHLAKSIETFAITKSVFSQYNLLKDIFYIKSKSNRNDCLVLGCTHYVIIKPIIKKYIDIPIIDGNEGVAREIGHKFLALTNNQQVKPSIKFIFSNDSKGLNENYKKILGQILANQINLC